MKRLLFVIGVCLLAQGAVYAQDAAPEDKDFSGLVRAARSDNAAAAVLEEAKESFFRKNDYQGFADFLAAVVSSKKSLAPWGAYYTGLARYRQMKYLEEVQNWDEYFSKGNDYRRDIEQNLEKAVKAFADDEPIHLYSRLTLWRYHKDQQDTFTEQAINDLMSSARTYITAAKDIRPVKDVADTLLVYEERSRARELYKLYGDKIISSDLSDDELQNTAKSFYNQDNLELSQALYTVYIDRILKKASPEKCKLELIEIAKLFSYKKTGPYDLEYAEKIFARIEELYTAAVFDEPLAYQRAYNVEKNRDYARAKNMYTAFAAAYPQSSHRDEALYKSGVLALYASRDAAASQEIFKSLSERPEASAHTIASLYQLGVIYQWQDDPAQATAAYAKLLELAKDGYGETAAAAKARMKELDENRPLEFNIKSLLDATLKPENSQFSMSRVEINPSVFSAAPGEEIAVASTATPPESGCMQVQLQYFWSGDTGKGQGAYQESSFTTAFADPGTKVIGVVVTTPGGIVDRAIALIDVS